MTENELAQLLITTTNSKRSVLFCILRAQVPHLKALQDYLNAVKACRIKGTLTQDQVRLIFFPEGWLTDGYHILYETLRTKNSQFLKVVLEEAETLLQKEDLRKLLISENNKNHKTFLQAILSYQDHTPELLADYFSALERSFDKGILSSDDIGKLLTTTNHGFTPINAALRNCPSMYQSFIERLRYFLTKNMLLPSVISHILTAPSEKGYTPLHEVLKTHCPENLDYYFNLITLCANKEILKVDHLKTLFTKTNTGGFNALHDAVRAKNPEILTKFINQVITLFANKNTNVGSLFTAVTNSGFTPLLTALNAGPDVYKIFLDKVKLCYENKLLSEEDLRSLLCYTSQDGFSTLHDVAKSSRKDNLTAYFAFVEYCSEKKILSAGDLIELFTSANKKGYTPLHAVLLTGNVTLFEIFIEKMRRTLNTDQLRSALLATTHARLNGLHQAATSGNLKIVERFIETIRETFPDSAEQELKSMAQSQTTKGNIPRCLESPDKKDINDLLASLVSPKKYNVPSSKKRELSRERSETFPEAQTGLKKHKDERDHHARFFPSRDRDRNSHHNDGHYHYSNRRRPEEKHYNKQSTYTRSTPRN